MKQSKTVVQPKQIRIGLHPKASVANEFVNSFTSSLEKNGFQTIESPVRGDQLKSLDFMIYHWPWFLERGVSIRRGLLGLRHIVKARLANGMKLIWVAHNVQPHGGGNRLLAWLFCRQLDGVIYLSEHSRQVVRTTHKFSRNVQELVTVHGAYNSNRAPQNRTEISAGPVNLFSFGQIRPYKGFDQLLRASSDLRAPATITITGRVEDGAFADLIKTTARDRDRITLNLRDDYLPKAELDSMIDACHGVVLPYRDILNSGAALHALSRARPVLVPNRGSMPELRAHIGNQWVHLYDDEFNGDDLNRFMSAIRDLHPEARPDLSAYSWHRVARDLTGYLDELATDFG
ncbi:MAG: hypothetical protein WBA51_18590 [Erythrobacter sp.]